jgi:hypothetical protein
MNMRLLCGVVLGSFLLLAKVAMSADDAKEVALPKLPKGAGEVDKDAPACDAAAALRPGSAPGPAWAGREVHAAIQAAIPWVSSTARPRRHPPLPATAALRSCS